MFRFPINFTSQIIRIAIPLLVPMEDSVIPRLLQCLDKSCRQVVFLRQELVRRDEAARDFAQSAIVSLTAIREKAEERETLFEACQREVVALRLQNEALGREIRRLGSEGKLD